jgi:hypothetical protein
LLYFFEFFQGYTIINNKDNINKAAAFIYCVFGKFLNNIKYIKLASIKNPVIMVDITISLFFNGALITKRIIKRSEFHIFQSI